MDLLAAEESGAFAPAYGEILGDAYAALGRVVEAQDAYQKVLLDPLSQGTIDQQLVQWKALDLPEIEPVTEPDVAAAAESAEPEPEAAVEEDEADPEGSE